MIRISLKKTFKQKRTGSKQVIARVIPANSKKWKGEIHGKFDTAGDAMNWIMNIIAIELLSPKNPTGNDITDYGEIFKGEIIKPSGLTEQYIFTKSAI